MGLLQNTKAYLSGPIEAVSDATSWRDSTKPDLKSLGIRIWDPLVKPKWMHPYAFVDGPKQRAWKSKILEAGIYNPDTWTREHENINEANHQIRLAGKRLAGACDFMICRMTGDFTAGTFEELAIASDKPVLFWSNSLIPSMWLFDQFGDIPIWDEIFFDSWDKLFDHLKAIDRGEVDLDVIKWIFLTWENQNA